MITLYRHKTDPKAEEIEQTFKDLVLAYRVETIAKEESGPFIVDGNQKIESDAEMETWFQKLEGELKWQRSISGDGCYIDPDTGNVC